MKSEKEKWIGEVEKERKSGSENWKVERKSGSENWIGKVDREISGKWKG